MTPSTTRGAAAPRLLSSLRRPAPEEVERARPHAPLLPGRPGPRPIAILDVEVGDLPPHLDVDPRYCQALVLLRWRGVPMAQALVPVREGRVAMEELRGAARTRVADRIAWRELLDWVGVPEAPVPVRLPTMTVAVCTRDRPDDLARCLAAIDRLPDDGQEVVVVDSCSHGDETRAVVAAHPRVRYVREARPGLDRARNRAMREARHAVVAFTDDDAAPDPEWLRALRRSFADPRTLCVTGLTLPIELETPAQVWFERTNGFGRGFTRLVLDGAVLTPYRAALAGAGVNMAIRRDVLQRLGPFDEALDAGTPARSGGDHEMFLRILDAGYQIVYEPAALVWHRHRREWSALVNAIRGYGTGVYAILTHRLLRHHDLGAPRLALGWLRYQLRDLWRAWRRYPGSAPPGLHLAELRGCLEGPKAYFAAQRYARTVARADSARAGLPEAGRDSPGLFEAEVRLPDTGNGERPA